MTTTIATIVVAIVSCVGTIVGSYLAHNKTTALVVYRIDELEKKVDKHNNVVERMAVMEKDMSAAWKRIDEIRAKVDD